MLWIMMCSKLEYHELMLRLVGDETIMIALKAKAQCGHCPGNWIWWKGIVSCSVSLCYN